MLKVDLARLERKRRVPLEAEVEADAFGVDDGQVRFVGPIRVALEAQLAGVDVLVRGTMTAEAELSCRRCLRPVRRAVDEEVTILYREDAAEGDAEDVFPLPARGVDLDLVPALREQLLLAVPSYVVCDEACRGFCPRCGVDWNERECACADDDVDDRWAALRKLSSK